jgi:hypothetical protein
VNLKLFYGALAAAMAVAAPVLAQPSKVLMSVRHPYWEVGTLDNTLSTECVRGNFNQIQTDQLKIVFTGPIGPAILGVATDVFNLHDPRKRATKNTSYFFFRDRTGACEVYRFVRGEEKRKQGAVPLDSSPYRSAIEDAYGTGWTLDESVKNRPQPGP